MDRVIDVIPLHISNWALKYKSILGEKRFRRSLCVCVHVGWSLPRSQSFGSRDQENEDDDGEDSPFPPHLIRTLDLCVCVCTVGLKRLKLGPPFEFCSLLSSFAGLFPVRIISDARPCLVFDNGRSEKKTPLSFCDPLPVLYMCMWTSMCLLSIDILPSIP
jgi:hypothetical protein